jgi:hypothetical protein
MTMRITALIVFGGAGLLAAADEPKQKVQVTKTERMDFPTGGTLRLTNSTGALTVEAWDRPGVEITTIKSSRLEYDAHERPKIAHELERVHVATERRGNELVVTTDCPKYWPWFPPNILDPTAKQAAFDLEYRIKAPSTARVIADHHMGEVNIDGLTGDIQVSLRRGEILLHLPQNGHYDIHAKSKFGDVNNDFPGEEKRRWWILGHRIVIQDSPVQHKLNLRVKFGDIVILKIREPKTLGPLISGSNPGGL